MERGRKGVEERGTRAAWRGVKWEGRERKRGMGREREQERSEIEEWREGRIGRGDNK